MVNSKLPFKFLALTDHSEHSKENSIYALLRTLNAHPNCTKTDVASRGNPDNASFFQNLSTTSLWASSVDASFDYQPDGRQFIKDTHLVDLMHYDVILLRLPRPISDEFLNNLAQIAQGKIIINHPNGIIKTSSKELLLQFPSLCPPIQLCKSAADIMAFAKKFPIVLKPLREYGGKGIVKIEGQMVYSDNTTILLSSWLDSMKSYIENEGYLGMKFLKNVTHGDKRILVVNGKILAASLRLPPENSWICNVSQGGSSVPAEPDAEEKHIIDSIAPYLLKEGILIFGADTLVNDEGKRVLSEINTLSIGGFPQAEKQTGRPVLQMTIDSIFDYINQYSLQNEH